MKKIAFAIVTLVLTIVSYQVVSSHRVKASIPFNPNNLIADSLFDNANTMSASQIDSWLNSNFPNSCISTNHGFSAPDPTGYSPSTGFTYGANVSAGRVIADAAKAYGLNPEVLLVTLQKEQSLVTGDAGCSTLRYVGATGYGCPDGGSTYNYSGVDLYTINGSTVTSVSGTCVNTAAKAGFSQQIIHATWLLKFGEQRSKGNTSWAVIQGNWDNSDDPGTCYGGPMTQGTFKRCSSDPSPVFYDGYITIDGSSTHMDDGATAALYWYTPHFSGNQNFDNTFTSWFGSLTGLDYAWQYAGINFSNGSSNVVGNTQVTIIVSATNIGNQAWSNTNFPVRLATFAPTNHQSSLYDSSWVSLSELATLNESVVLPGNTGTFTFKVNVPNINGLYTERFNLEAVGSTWFPDPDFSIQLNITQSTYRWQMVSQSSDHGFLLQPNSTATLTLVARNTGNTTWNNSANPVRLATFIPTDRSSAFYDNSWFSPTRPATLQEASVAPGQTGTFIFTVHAPSQPGFYAERFNLVMEGVSWFQDPWMEFDINVGNFYTWKMAGQSSSTGSFVLNRNSTATFTLFALNTGNVTWTNSGTPVRLATWNPSYRTSIFNPNDGSWISPYRAANLDNSTPSVTPGGTGKFVFNVKAPSTPGFYVERFNLVMEGVSWFQDPWMEFDITVN